MTNKSIHLWISLARANSSPPPPLPLLHGPPSTSLRPTPRQSQQHVLHLTYSVQGTLVTLSTITLSQSFLATSPFAHLTPSISTLATSPFTFFSDWLSVVRLHQDYISAQTAESRARNIADAQKRRLYRRAHGMEDTDKDGVGEGVDVKGLVDWDDGMTRGERERGVEAAREMLEKAGTGDGRGADDANRVAGREMGEDEETPSRRQRRPLRKWLGIW